MSLKSLPLIVFEIDSDEIEIINDIKINLGKEAKIIGKNSLSGNDIVQIILALTPLIIGVVVPLITNHSASNSVTIKIDGIEIKTDNPKAIKKILEDAIYIKKMLSD